MWSRSLSSGKVVDEGLADLVEDEQDLLLAAEALQVRGRVWAGAVLVSGAGRFRMSRTWIIVL